MATFISNLRLLTFLFILASLLHRSHAELERFNTWYPRYASGLTNIVHTTCATNYQAYLDHLHGIPFNVTAIPNPDVNQWEAAHDETIAPLIDCILTALPQIVQSGMAASQVLLGLMPTIVILLAPRMQDTAMLLALGRRPFLATLLAFGAPFVALAGGINYREEFEALRDEYNWTGRKNVSRVKRAVVSVVEYVAIVGCIANNAWLAYEIPKRASFSLFQESYYLPGLWTFAGVIIRFVAAAALRIDAKVSRTSRPGERSWLPRLTTPEHGEGFEKMQIQLRPPSALTVCISWVSTISTVGVLVGGTVMFSTVLFVGARDAVGILLRLILSGTVCKVIGMYELSILRTEIAVEILSRPGREVVMMKEELPAERLEYIVGSQK